MQAHTIMYTDGACSGNPGPGGWGSLIVIAEEHVIELGGFQGSTTNNRMELKAAIRGLELLTGNKWKDRWNEPLELYCDSKYVIDGSKSWIHGWKKRGWKTSAGGEVQNQDLWRELDPLLSKVKINWHYVPGHSGFAGNERVDAIAQGYSKKADIDLFDGAFADYDLGLSDLIISADTPIPGASKALNKTKRSGKKAFSYVSYVDGRIETHTSWPQCEARVKGRAGVKFKKALSAQDEQQIIKEFTGEA